MGDKINFAKHLKEFQNKQNLEHMIKKTAILRTELFNEMRSYGILNSVIEKILMGVDVMNCPDCNSPNMYFSHFETETKNYKCAKCDSTYQI